MAIAAKTYSASSPPRRVPPPPFVSAVPMIAFSADDVLDIMRATDPGRASIPPDWAELAAADLQSAVDAWIRTHQSAERAAASAKVRDWALGIARRAAKLAEMVAAGARPHRIPRTARALLAALGLEPDATLQEWHNSDAAVHLVSIRAGRDVPDAALEHIVALARGEARPVHADAASRHLTALAEAARQAGDAEGQKACRGRPRDEALDQLLSVTIAIYVMATGRGVGASPGKEGRVVDVSLDRVGRVVGVSYDKEGHHAIGPAIRWHRALFQLIGERLSEAHRATDRTLYAGTRLSDNALAQRLLRFCWTSADFRRPPAISKT